MKQKTPTLGDLEQLLLLAILRLGDEAYGVSIRAEVLEKAGRKVSPGALFTMLVRMEDKGLLKSRMGEPTTERGGRAKRFFSVTPQGVSALKSSQRAYINLLQGLNLLDDRN
jgi:PadR family transcriptional regulator, regulatory protein PadR